MMTGLICLYALLVAVGGIVGYAKARSRVSLMSGVGSGVALAIAAYASWQTPSVGLGLATAIAALLLVVFAIRFRKTRSLMPAGLMTGLSLLATIVFAWGWLAASTAS
jgi:uncharacterized membrane protein (UPF0136 family)